MVWQFQALLTESAQIFANRKQRCATKCFTSSASYDTLRFYDRALQWQRGGRMARPYWTGNIQISLVSFGVSLYVATETKNQISFHQISRKTGERVRHQKVLESAVENNEPASAVDK